MCVCVGGGGLFLVYFVMCAVGKISVVHYCSLAFRDGFTH